MLFRSGVAATSVRRRRGAAARSSLTAAAAVSATRPGPVAAIAGRCRGLAGLAAAATGAGPALAVAVDAAAQCQSAADCVAADAAAAAGRRRGFARLHQDCARPAAAGAAIATETDLAAMAGRPQEPADDRDRRRRAVDWPSSPPTPCHHARRIPRRRKVWFDLCAAHHCACSQISVALPTTFPPRTRAPRSLDEKQIWRKGGDRPLRKRKRARRREKPDNARILAHFRPASIGARAHGDRQRGWTAARTHNAGISARHWCRRSRMSSTIRSRWRACAPDAAPDRSATPSRDCRD